MIDADTNRSRSVPDQIEGAFCGLAFDWSPKGGWLAYTTKSEAQPRRKIFNPTTGEAQGLPGANIDFVSLVWSTNEHYLAYRSDSQQDGYSWIIRDIRNQQTIGIFNLYESEFPSWSPTENRISFRSDPDHITIYNVIDDIKQEYESNSLGAWSPDGKFLILYNSSKGQIILLSVTNALDNKTIELDRGIRIISSEGLSPWSSNSRYLALSKPNATNDQRTVSILDVLKNSIQPAGINIGDFDTFAWSPVGNRLAIVSDTKNIEGMPYFTALGLLDANDQESQHYDVKIPIMDSEQRINWSPNGRDLIIQNDGVTLVNWSSAKMELIDNGAHSFARPHWSPDGSRLALVTHGAITNDIYVFTPGENRLNNITHTPNSEETFLGWRRTKNRAESLSYCGEG